MAENFLSSIFGSGGSAATTFSDLWFFVGIFIFLFFILYLVSRGVSAENTIIFTATFILVVITEGLFNFPLIYLILPLVLIGLYASVYVYYWFNK